MKVFRRKSKINKIVPYVEIKECDYNDIIHSEKYFKRKEPYVEKVLRPRLQHITFSVDSHPKSLIIRSIAINIFFIFVRIIIDELIEGNRIVLKDLGEIELRSKPFDIKYKGWKRDFDRAKNKGFYTMIQVTYSKHQTSQFKYGFPYWSFGEYYKKKVHNLENKGKKF